MQVSSTNVVPESANHMLVSLNGILQKPNSSFTISGSTITFASNLATGDVIDFIMLLGNVLILEHHQMPQLQMLKQICINIIKCWITNQR